MSVGGNVSLGALRLQARQRADLENSQAVSDSEFNQYISQSYKRLYDMLVAAYGNDYYVADLFQFAVGSSQYYPLPDGTIVSIGETDAAPALYKLLGVDLQYGAAPTGWVTLKRFEEIDRNKYAWPNTAVNSLGYSNLRYRLSGSNIEFLPVPMSGQVVQLKYIPVPTSIQFLLSCATVLDTAVLTLADVSDLSVGMSVAGSGIRSGATILSIDTGANTVTLSSNAQATAAYATIAFWKDSTTINGIAGWEEYIIIDAAIKAKVKQEQDTADLRAQKAEMVDDIKSMAEGRDVGQAMHVSDVLGANGDGYGGFGGGDGFGNGFF